MCFAPKPLQVWAYWLTRFQTFGRGVYVQAKHLLGLKKYFVLAWSCLLIGVLFGARLDLEDSCA